ncbi:MAG: DNA-binding response regulator [Chloroflexota bacterium]|nr:MAG: DNA-binding response regulator [Chloroflexota bacterium]
MIRILIVDDHAIVRAGIRVLLQLQPDFEVVGEAEDGREALRQVQQLAPDIALMDIGMPGMDGLAATRAILQNYPQVRIIALTQHENREYVLPTLRAGAKGYVLKRAPDDTLVRAIRTVAAGGSFLDPRIADVVTDSLRQQGAAPADPLETLTEREREVLQLLASGKTYQEIADTLFISVKTVDFHRTNLMRKLNLANRTELVQFAIKRSLLS